MVLIDTNRKEYTNEEWKQIEIEMYLKGYYDVRK